MFNKKRQIIKFDQNHCNANINDNSVLFVRVQGFVNDKNAIVEVPITHNAIIIKGGGDMRFYESGNFDVFDNRTEVKDWKKGLSVDVVYIPKETCVPILWGTPDKVKYRDIASNKVISVGARGKFDAVVLNPNQFFRKVVGVRTEFDLVDFRKRFSTAVVSEFSDCFLHVVDENGLTYDKFDLNKKRIGEKVGEILSEKFEKTWGIGLSEFIIEAFSISEEDINAVEDAAAEAQKQEKLKEYLKELERLDDKQWEREKYLRQLELQDKAAYYEVLKVIGSDEKRRAEKEAEALKCPNCNLPYKPTDKFCPHCGTRVSKDPIVCPECGKVNECTAVFCSGCGKKL